MELELQVINPELLPLGCQAHYRFGRLGGLIGRGDDCDWVIPDPERLLSTRHALVRYEAGRFFIVDISTNGIYLNQDELPLTRELPVALHQGDCLQLGGLLMRVQCHRQTRLPTDGEPAQSVPLAHPDDITVRHPLPDETVLQPTVSRDERSSSQANSASQPVMPGAELCVEAPPTPDVETAPPQHTDQHTRLLAAFCRGLGVPQDVFQRVAGEEVLERAGHCLQICFAGMLELMQQRVQLKHQFRVDLTYVQHADNNPVKFSVSQKQLLRYFLKPEAGTFMAVDAGLQECFDDLAAHQAAVLAGAQQGLLQLFERLSPEAIEARVNGQSSRALAFANRKAPLWDAYCTQHALLADSDDVFDRVFGGPFAHAYQQAVQKANHQPRSMGMPKSRPSAA